MLKRLVTIDFTHVQIVLEGRNTSEKEERRGKKWAKFMPDSPPAQQTGPVYQYGPPPGAPLPGQPGAAAPAVQSAQGAPAALVGTFNQGILRSVM
ncbi:hypothetical protein PV327_009372 [Microctonus hyperodae]|uniref:Uncharacterized protein n=1 Tax=Microctonus hyperodae TaxID=165561 RepID=A0AA39FU89_MICHY|nr:hypothetical protein PV327_009372 [Microctonus hyperodae]